MVIVLLSIHGGSTVAFRGRFAGRRGRAIVPAALPFQSAIPRRRRPARPSRWCSPGDATSRPASATSATPSSTRCESKVQAPVTAYGVNYPADVDPAKGANDMSNHVQSMAKHCPNTREVLGGYSLGAIVRRPRDRGDQSRASGSATRCRRARTARRGGRAVRQRHPAGAGPGARFQPRLRRQDDRLVCPRRSDLFERHQLAVAPEPSYLGPGWWIRPPLSPPAGFSRGCADRG